MRYFTRELLSRINDTDENIRNQAEREWNENNIAYQQRFEETKKHLSSTFIKNYFSRQGLHDYTVLEILIKKSSREYSCSLQLSNGSETVLIIMSGLKLLQISIDSFEHCIQRRLRWGYSEFEQVSEGSVRLSVLCDTQNEMQFEFMTIRLVRHKTD